MADKFSVQNAGKWSFRLQQEQTLQFHISSDEQEAGTPLTIEGHDISSLLDYLYDNRELIYKATHDSQGHHLGEIESRDGTNPARPAEQHVERIFYIDDGDGRKQTYP